MAVRVQIDKIEKSKGIGAHGDLVVSLDVKSDALEQFSHVIQFKTDVAVNGTGDLAKDIDQLRRQLCEFATELARAVESEGSLRF